MNKIDNRENTIIDIRQSQENTSLLSLWNAIAPKLNLARKFVLSAVGDLIERKNVEDNEPEMKSLKTLHWKNTEKSVWTISTIEKRKDSPSSIYINPSVLKEILALDKELESVLDDLNLPHDERNRQLLQQFVSRPSGKLAVVSSKSKRAFGIRPSRTKSSFVSKNNSTTAETSGESSSSISLYSDDGTGSEKSDEIAISSPSSKKKNLIIKCNYNRSSASPSSGNFVHVYRNDSCCQATNPCRCERTVSDRCRRQRKAQENEEKEKQRKKERERRRSLERKESKKRHDQERRRSKERQYKERKRSMERKDKERKEKERKARERGEKERNEKERKEKERRENERRRKERKEKEKREKKYRSDDSISSDNTRNKSKKKYKSDESVSRKSNGTKNKTHTDASRESVETEYGTCKVELQCGVPPKSKCCSRCKGTQAENLKKRVAIDTPDCPPTCRRSRLSRIMSNLGRSGLQVRLIPPGKNCSGAKSCIIPKLCSPSRNYDVGVGSSCRIPALEISRSEKPVPPETPSCYSTPCNDPPPSNYSPHSNCPPCQFSQCDLPITPQCSSPSTLPPCNLRPSLPRLTPCAVPPRRSRPSCRSTPRNSRPCTPPPYDRQPCGSLIQLTPRHRSSKPCGCGCNSRHSTPPTCNSRLPIPPPCAASCHSDLSVPPPPCDSRPCTPPPGGFRPCTPSSCSQLPCNPSTFSSPPCTPATCSLPPCSPDSRTSCNRTSCLKPCIARPPISTPCDRRSMCSRPRRPQPPSCDSDCNVKKWSCCTARKTRCRSPSATGSSRPSCSRVSICAPGPRQESCSRPRMTTCRGPTHYSRPFSPQPCRSADNCSRTQRFSDFDICPRRSSCAPRSCCYLQPCYLKPCESSKSCRPHPYSLSCSDSDVGYPRTPSARCSRRDVCYAKRKCNRPWWTPRSRRDEPRPYIPCSRSPSCYSDDWCDDPIYHRRRCDHERCLSPYCSDPNRRRSCTPPPCRSIPCSPPPCSPSYPPPCPPLCMPPCPPSCPPRYPPPCPQYLCPYPYPSCLPAPCSARTSCESASFFGHHPPGEGWGTPSCEPSPCRPNFLFGSKCVKGPPGLKKMPKLCGRKPCSKRTGFGFPKPCGSRTPVCPPRPCTPCNPALSCEISPCVSPDPSCLSFRHPNHPSPSCSSYSSNYWPYFPSDPVGYPQYPYYWPNYYSSYGENRYCYPSPTYGKPSCSSFSPSLRHKPCLSNLKCTKYYRMSCDSGLPKYKKSASSNSDSESSCSSSSSTFSSRDTSNSSRTSSASGTSSRTSTNYCVASCRNSLENIFNSRSRSCSSVCSSSDTPPRRKICNEHARCQPDRKICGSPLTFEMRGNQFMECRRRRQCGSRGPVCAPPIPCRMPADYQRSQVCSSATDVYCDSKLRSHGIHHYDERIRFELQKIGMNQLIKASKPAKCCKQTVLNQPSREELPYAASLASLPLDRADIRVIKQSVRMATQKADCNYTSLQNRTKLVYYANLVTDDFNTKKPSVEPKYEVRYFYVSSDEKEKAHKYVPNRNDNNNMFRFFQICNWSVDRPTRKTTAQNPSQNEVDFTTSLDFKKCIVSPKHKGALHTSISAETSKDVLENLVFSDFNFAGKSEGGDTIAEEYPIMKHKSNIELKREEIMFIYSKTNFPAIETSLGTDSLTEIILDCKSIIFGPLINAVKSKNQSASKVDAYSQTIITQDNLKNFKVTSDATSQTKCFCDDRTNYADDLLSRKIAQLLNSDPTSIEFLKKDNRLIVTSEASLETDSLEIHLNSELFKNTRRFISASNNSNDEEFIHSNAVFEGAIIGVLSQIKELATMANAFKTTPTYTACKTTSSFVQATKSNDFLTEKFSYGPSASQRPLEYTPSAMQNFIKLKSNSIKVLRNKSSIDNSKKILKSISKEQFVIRMYESIDNMISKIYSEAGKLAKLRRNRLSILGEGSFTKNRKFISKEEKSNGNMSNYNSSHHSKKLILGTCMSGSKHENNVDEMEEKERQNVLRKLLSVIINSDSKSSYHHLETVYTSAGKIITKFYNFKGETLNGIYDSKGKRVTRKSASARELVRALYDNEGKFLAERYDSRGNMLKAVYDSEKKLLLQTFNSEMLLMKFPSENHKKRKSKQIFNSQGFPIYQLYTRDGNLLTSIYDFKGNLIRGTFLGNVSQLFPRIFDGQGKFILGRYGANGKMIKGVFDSHGHNLQQLYKPDRTVLQKTPMMFKILNQNGDPIQKFYTKNKVPLTYVYDVLGNLLCQAINGNAKDLLCRLFDLNGFFIVGRLDELRRLIEAVYDQKGNKISQLQVLDNEIGNMNKMSRIYNFKGQLLVNFYDENGICLKSIHDAKGALIESSPTGRAVKLAGRIFDMAGYFINGRYDARKNILREIYDHEGYKILQIYDIDGRPVRRTTQPTKVYSSKGKHIKRFFTCDHRILSSLYDINGNMIGGVISNNAEELAPYLFDIEGKFINSRYDSQMNLLEHVYDSKSNLLNRVLTEGMLNPKLNRENTKSVKTVYVKLDSRDHNYKGSTLTAFGNMCQSQPKSNHGPIATTKMHNKPLKCFPPLKKMKVSNEFFDERRQLRSVKCQCKRSEGESGRNQQRIRTSSGPAGQYNSQKLGIFLEKTPSSRNTAVKHSRYTKKEPKKSAGVPKSKARRSVHHEQRKVTGSRQKSRPRETEVLTTILPCYGTTGSPSQRNGDSLESLLNDYLEKDVKHNLNLIESTLEMSPGGHVQSDTSPEIEAVTSNKENVQERSNEPKLSDVSDNEDTMPILGLSDSSHTTDSNTHSEDAFLCSLPNAPPFILKMNKVSTDAATKTVYFESPTQIVSNTNFEYSTTSSLMDDSLDLGRISTTDTALKDYKKSGYTRMSEFNMFIDNACPGTENPEFNDFIAKSITLIKDLEEVNFCRRTGYFMSSPTICMTGLTGFSNNPFRAGETDSRGPGKNTTSFLSTDVLYKKNSFHYYSKIPRMLHPGKCKVHTKMKNVQLSSGPKGCAANRGQASSSPKACTGPCPAEKMDIQISPYVKVSVSTTCPSMTNTSGSNNLKGGKQGSKNKNANVQTPASQSSMGDCVKGIKSDPGCYCGNTPIEPTPCPVRLKEDCECVEDEDVVEVEEEDEALCYCPPGEQPLLLKKSNIECDCANRRRCEDEVLVEPPKEKPNVFWALTKVSLLKDGTKNFEIIDVSPVPPGYYLMPDVNNLVLVGPQPKPAKPAPSKNCSCK